MSWGIFTPIINAIAPNRVARLSRQQILAKYGQPDRNYLAKYCIIWNIKQDFAWFPASKIYINKDFMLALSGAFRQLEAEGKHIEIIEYNGCYEDRNTRGSNLISLHAYAMAIDLNASTEKLGQKVANWSPRFLEIMRMYVYCGADFISRTDPMHFSLYGE